MSATTEKTSLYAQPWDFVWTRRARRSFHLLVVTTLLFTVALWFAEGYLRYDKSETQYRMSLTLHPAQARPILRTVVRRETQLNKGLTPDYIEALALVEEPDKALDTFAHAYEANQRNTSLLLSYGCRLYAEGRYDEARERFREAGANPPENALPRYLEAAAFAATLTADADPGNLTALLTRVNISDDPVLFPEPLWHTSLPKQGLRYAQLQMDMAKCLLEPLNQCCIAICSRAREGISRGGMANWDDHLEKIQYMGERLMGTKNGDSMPTILQLKTALQIQVQALSLRAEYRNLSEELVPPEMENAVQRLNEAIAVMESFEAQLPAAIEEQWELLRLPATLVMKTATLFFVLYGIALLLRKIGVSGKHLRPLPHTRMAILLPPAGFVLMMGLLFYVAVGTRLGSVGADSTFIPALWFGLVGILLAVGIAYPWMQTRANLAQSTLSSVSSVKTDEAIPEKEAGGISLRRRIGIYGFLFQRYMGLISGELIIMICVWCIIHRIALNAYPFQMQLLGTSLEGEMQKLILLVQEQVSGMIL